MVYAYPNNINPVARPAGGSRRDKPDHGRRLVARRAELGLSLADIERETDGVVYDQLVWRIENGKKEPASLKFSQRDALARVLQWSRDQLDHALGFIDETEVRQTYPAEIMSRQSSGNRLQGLRVERGLARSEVAERTQNILGARRLANLEEKEGAWEKVAQAEIDALSAVYGLTENQFLEAVNGTPYAQKPNIYTDEATLINPNLRYGTRKIPKYRSVGMGPGGRGGELIGYIDIPETWTGEFFSYDAVGDSMSPLIPDGTELIIREQSHAEPDEVVLCYTPDEGTMLKVYGGVSAEGDIKLLSFNEAYTPIWTRELTIYGTLWETRTAWKANGRRRK